MTTVDDGWNFCSACNPKNGNLKGLDGETDVNYFSCAAPKGEKALKSLEPEIDDVLDFLCESEKCSKKKKQKVEGNILR